MTRNPFAPKWRRVEVAEEGILSGIFFVRRPTYAELLEFHEDRNALEACIEHEDRRRVFHENGCRFSECDAAIGSIFTSLVLGDRSKEGIVQESDPSTPR